MTAATISMSPQLLAEVQRQLLCGPRPDSVEITVAGQRIVLLWRELPGKLAAALMLVGGVLFLLVSPTAPDTVDHAGALLRHHMSTGAPATTSRQSIIPGPRGRLEDDEASAQSERRVG